MEGSEDFICITVPDKKVSILTNSSVTHCMLLRMLFQSCSMCWGSCSHATVVLEEVGLCHHLLLFTESVLQGNMLEIFLGHCPTSAGAVFKHEVPSSTHGHYIPCQVYLHPYNRCQILQAKQQGLDRF